jgi:hypothetical protein
MACVAPLTGWRSKFVNPKTGKRSIVFSPNDGYKDMEVTVPCGRCHGCRLEHSRQWAVRCVHEAQMHKENSFITLTYSPENLPKDHSIHKEELQRFFKRLRKNTGKRFKYFACGEYGEKNNRPHYHAILFGQSFYEDRYLHTKTRNGDILYRSPTLEKSWTLGHSLIGEMSFQSAAYVARYCMKKRKGDNDAIDPKTGKTNKEHYMVADPDTGEIHQIEPEFCLSSRGSGKKDDQTLWRYGLGRAWLEKFQSDTNKDYITVNKQKMSLPRYYDNVLAVEDELDMMDRKRKRKKFINPEEQTYERLATKEKVMLAKTNQLKRNLEGL